MAKEELIQFNFKHTQMLNPEVPKTIQLFFFLILIGSNAIAQVDNGIVNSGELIKKGVELHDTEKYDEALKYYNQVPESDTNYGLATAEKALAYYAKKDYENAIKLCEEALKIGTEYDNNLYVTLGSAYDDSDKHEKAIEVFNKGISEFPKSYLILFNKATTLEKQGNLKEAVEAYKQTLLLNPFHASSHLRLGRIAEQEGELTKAMLCYNTFLLVEPASNRSLSVLDKLDMMASKKYDNSNAKGIKLSDKGDDFQEIETLIRKQLALNKNYKLESKADYPVVRQNQALLSYLPKHKGTDGFWEKLYVPFYADVYNKGFFEPYSYFILMSSTSDKIKSLVTKNKNAITKFNEWQTTAYNKSASKRTLDIGGKKVEGSQVYYKNGALYGFGPYDFDNSKKTGKWEFYYNSGRLLGTGNFDANSKQTGEWKFYYPEGKLKKEASFANDEEAGPYKLYHRNGNLTESGNHTNGKLSGEIKTFTIYGGLKEFHNFKEGQHQGKYEEYHDNGKVKLSATYVNNKFQGPYKSIYPNGQTYIDGNFKEDLKEGSFTAYHHNGKVLLKKTYVQNKENGPYIKYYKNEKTQEEGAFKNGNPTGKWNLYFLNGSVDEITPYSESGEINGTQQYFDIDGKLYYEAEYKDGKLLAYKNFDKNGNVIHDTKLKGKQEIKNYFSEGAVKWVGTLENGKRTGLWKEYFRNGILKSEYNYKDGKLNGEGKEYFYNGKTFRVVNYKDGNYQGKYREYFRNGQLRKSAWYEDGDGYGDVYTYEIDGTPESKYTVTKGNLTGKYYNYDCTGKLQSVEVYENDNFTNYYFYDTTGKEIASIPINKEKLEVSFLSVTGDVTVKRTYQNGSKEGPSKGVFLNGKTSSDGQYLNSKRDGVWKWYNPDNTLNSVRTYDNGNLDGVYENYDLFGKIKSRYDYIDGSSYGLGYMYYYNGNKKEEVNYWDDDENGDSKFYGFNGEQVLTQINQHNILKKIVYINGKSGKPDTVDAPISGTIEAKYSNGKTAVVIERKNEYQNGKYLEFFEDGTPCRSATYVDNLLDGERKTFYKNGKLMSSEIYKLDNKEGVTTIYYESGTKKAELSYKLDVLHGPVKYFDAQGKLIAHYIFYNGNMIKIVL
jgi:antitoxin component YwqK of YwqJK toxin-antitoxin module